jgi:elongation factor Ts
MDLVKKLREATAAPLGECREAVQKLARPDGSLDMDAAVTYLRKKGVETAGKKAHRAAAEGLVGTIVAPSRHAAAMVEINCETDFVARNEHFHALLDTACTEALRSVTLPAGGATFAAAQLDVATLQKAAGVSEALLKGASTLRENIVLRRGALLSVAPSPTRVIGAYVHGLVERAAKPAGVRLGKIAAVVALETQSADKAEEAARLAERLAVHVVAAQPQFLDRQSVPKETLERETEILREQAQRDGKDAKTLDKVVQGRLSKFFEEAVLLDQPFLAHEPAGPNDKPPKVAQLLDKAAARVLAFQVLRRGEA